MPNCQLSIADRPALASSNTSLVASGWCASRLASRVSCDDFGQESSSAMHRKPILWIFELGQHALQVLETNRLD